MASIPELIADYPNLAGGVPLGHYDWRFHVEIAKRTAGSATVGNFIVGTDKVGGREWVDCTNDFQGCTIEEPCERAVFARATAPTLSLSLANENGQYSPLVSSWHGPGTLVRISCTYILGDGYLDVELFTGFVTTWNERNEFDHRWIEIEAMHPMILLAQTNKPALSSPLGWMDTSGGRVRNIANEADWPFEVIKPSYPDDYYLQATTLSSDYWTEALLAADSGDMLIIPNGKGDVSVVRHNATDLYVLNAQSWLIGGDPEEADVWPVVNSIQTSNDDQLLISEIALSRVGGSSVTYKGNLPGRYGGARTFQRTDLITINPPSDDEPGGTANADIAYVAQQVLARGRLTYRPTGFTVDSNSDGFYFLLFSENGSVVNVIHEGALFSNFKLWGRTLRISPMTADSLHWITTYELDVLPESTVTAV